MVRRDQRRRAGHTPKTKRSPTRSTPTTRATACRGKPAPMLLQSGWTDDLFPPAQSLRVYNAGARCKGYAALLFGDLGHSRGSNKENTDHAFQEEGARVLRGAAAARRHGAGERQRDGLHADVPAERARRRPVHGQEVVEAAPARGHVRLGRRADVHLGRRQPDDRRRIRPDRRHQRRVQDGQSRNRAEHGQLHDRRAPASRCSACRRSRRASKRPGRSARSSARLWDVLPSGEQRLISRGVYRLTENQTGTITFQLHGNGYEFAAGDTVKLQLLGRDAPYYRASNGAFTHRSQQPDGLAADAVGVDPGKPRPGGGAIDPGRVSRRAPVTPMSASGAPPEAGAPATACRRATRAIAAARRSHRPRSQTCPTSSSPRAPARPPAISPCRSRQRGPATIVLQEWWGLDEHIRAICDRFAAEGFFALAPDLYRGETTTAAERGRTEDDGPVDGPGRAGHVRRGRLPAPRRTASRDTASARSASASAAACRSGRRPTARRSRRRSPTTT